MLFGHEPAAGESYMVEFACAGAVGERPLRHAERLCDLGQGVKRRIVHTLTYGQLRGFLLRIVIGTESVGEKIFCLRQDAGVDGLEHGRRVPEPCGDEF